MLLRGYFFTKRSYLISLHHTVLKAKDWTKSKVFVSFLAFFYSFLLQAQPLCIVKHYSTDDGLSHNGIMCMLEDHQGFMWFGTWDGLNRFDGYNFAHYKSRPGDSCQLSNNRIDDIKEDKFGFLWVKTYDEKIYRFDRRNELFQGIPHSLKKYSTMNISVNSLYQTSSGEMWLLAKNIGCFRIITDTTDFSFRIIHYSANYNDKYLLNSNNVNFVLEDSQKDIWIGTDNGLQVISKKNKQDIDKFAGPLKRNDFTTAFESNGCMWFGTSGGKLIMYNLSAKTGKEYLIRPGVEVNAILKLPSGLLLVSSRKNGLFTFDPVHGTFVNYTKEKYPALGDNQICSLYLDRFGVVWIETESPGVVRFKSASNDFRRFLLKTDQVSPFVYNGNFYKVFEDVNNDLWINLKGGGFCYYNRSADKVEYFYNEPGSPQRLFSNLTVSALSDSYGNLWLSTYSRGIENVRFLKSKFKLNRLSTEANMVSVNNVRSIFEDNHRNLWVGTKHGELYCYDKERKLRKVFSQHTAAAGDICFDGMVYDILQDKEGNLWFGTKGDGLIKAVFDGNPDKYRFKTVHYRNNAKDAYSISSNFIYTICEDAGRHIWVGTFGGGINLLEEKNGTIRFRNSNNSFYNYPSDLFNKVRHIQKDAIGRMWVGTTNGLIIFRPDSRQPDAIKFYCYQKTAGDINSLSSNDVHYIFNDRSNQIWIGTFGGGLNKLVSELKDGSTPKFKTFNTTYDLPVDIVLGIQEDRKGNLWLSTENGLSMFKPREEKFINFSELDGLRKTTFSEAGCAMSSSGELFFGCSDGFYSFNPDHITVENTAPPLTFINLQLFNRNVKIGAEGSPLPKALSEMNSITLTHNQSVFSIEYAGLDFRTPEKLEYAFILEGFEKEWNYVQNQRKATYTNLPPGKYTFKVKCSVNGLFEDKPGRQLDIIILPPWWKTWYAYLGYLIVILIFILVIRNISLKIVTLKNKVVVEQMLTDLKLKFFTNISHELRTPLTLIISPTEELLKNKQLETTAREDLETIDKNARRMLKHINQLLDFRKIQTGKMRLKIHETEIVAFVNEICSGFKELAAARNITFTFHANKRKIYGWIDTEKLDTAVFNLLSNAFKFTPEKKKIEVVVNGLGSTGYFEIIVKDQGIGIDKNEQPYLFQQFAISHKSSDGLTKGTGIGLSLVKEIIDLHKGTIVVDSTPGEGSTFVIRLKQGKDHFSHDEVEYDVDGESVVHAMQDENIPDTSPAPDVAGNAKRDAPVILIVEDNIELRAYLHKKLKPFYTVEESADGLDGWNKAQLLSPDLIISDIMMPGMDGIQLTDKLRNDFRTSHIPIVLLTAKSTIENMIEGIKYGADAYITKPFHMDFLLTRISSLLDIRKKLIGKFSNPVKVMDLSPDEVVVTAKDEQFLKDVIKFIEENMSNPDFNVEMISNKIGLGRTTFFKKLKGLTGMAPVEFMREMRVKRGHQLLHTGNFTVSEVAFQVGFNDAGYFSKCFREKYNLSPVEYMKNEQEKGVQE